MTYLPPSVPPELVVTTLASTGVGSFDEAMALAASDGNPHTITFDPSLIGIVHTSGQYQISNTLTIDGGVSDRITIDADSTHRHFQISTVSGAVNLRGLTLSHGSAYRGGSIHVDSGAHLVVDDVTFFENEAITNWGYAGAAVMVASQASIEISNSRFSYNHADAGSASGGALSVEDGIAASIIDTTFDHNSTNTTGAAAIHATTVTIDGVAMLYNTVRMDSSSAQGGMRIIGDHLAITNVFAAGNDGRQLVLDAGAESTISHVRLDGGSVGISIQGSVGTTRIDHASVSGTTLAGIIADVCSQTISITQSTVSGNLGDGIDSITARGAFYCPAGEALTVSHSTIAHNGRGIGFIGAYSGRVNIDHTIVAENVVDLGLLTSARWSLVEDPGVYLTIDTTNTITGVDPHLSDLVIDHDTGLGVCTFDANSAAFNAGDSDFVPPPELDEIGQPRLAFGRIDIGAWELQPTPDPTTTTAGGDPVVPAFTG